MTTKSTDWSRVRSIADAKRYRIGAGEPVMLDEDLTRIYFTVGVYEDELEIVSYANILERDLVDPDSMDDVLEAVNDGRLSTIRCARDRLLPLPGRTFEHIDIDEVRR